MMNNRPELRLAPPEPDIGETDGFEKSDLFGYAEFGGRLANVVHSLQTPLVLALTGGWGIGKSVFAKQWAGELRKRWANPQDNSEDGKVRTAESAPVIYFDAFANDHQNNALFALAGEVMEFIGRRKKITGKMRGSAKRIAKGVGGVLAEGVARYATGGLASAGNIAAAMQSALEKRMAEAGQGRDAIKEFRNALESAAQELGGGHPLVFIVDELDRCRPDFALELLEKIKHLFSVPNVCFLVVTNLEQFRAVVERAYGYNADEARAYLDKFFHHVFWLPNAKGHCHKIDEYAFHLWSTLNLPKDNKHSQFASWMKKISAEYEISLRDMEQIFAPLVLACTSTLIQRDADYYYGAAMLCVLRKIDNQLYLRVLQGDASWNDMPAVIRDSPTSESTAAKLGMNDKKALADFAEGHIESFRIR